jgi:L-cysteine/cystine lyase
MERTAIAAELPAAVRGYFNTGSAGPLCRAAREALAALADEHYREGRVGPGPYRRSRDVRAEARAAVAGLIGADPDEVALMPHTSEGMNVVAWGLPWRAGDVALMSDVEHQGAALPLGALRARLGVQVRTFSAARAAESLGRELARGSVRLVALSHVSYATGQVLPVAEIADLAHRHGALVAVDGAQSAGALPVDVRALGVDFYALPGQKWLLGPEGTGALYVRRERLLDLAPTFVGWASASAWDAAGWFVPSAGAARFEVGTVYPPGFAALTAALRWIGGEVGWDTAHARTFDLAERLRTALAATPGVRVLTPREHAGLISFAVEGRTPAAALEDLAARGLTLRTIPRPSCLRASVAWFHDEAQVDELATAVAAIARIAREERRADPAPSG